MNEPITEQPVATAPEGKRTPRVVPFVNMLLGCAILALLFGAYSYLKTRAADEPKDQNAASAPAKKIIQLDVLNGCGATGAAARFTSFLRNAGFDVVEMKNYKVRTIEKSMVVDRVGNLAAARRVASALGIQENNVVQQLNPDYFVDVSVIIGADFKSLEPLRH